MKNHVQRLSPCNPEVERQLIRLFKRGLFEAIEASKVAKVDVMTEKEFRQFRREVDDFLWNLRLDYYLELDAAIVEEKLVKRKKAMLKMEERRNKKRSRSRKPKSKDPKLAEKQAAWDKRWEERTKLKLEAKLLRKRGMYVSKQKYSKRLGKRPSQFGSSRSSSTSLSSSSSSSVLT